MSAKSTPRRISSAGEVTSRIQVAGFSPGLILGTPCTAFGNDSCLKYLQKARIHMKIKVQN